ncbi:MAG: YdcF family protein [Myxococcota bacterium]
MSDAPTTIRDRLRALPWRKIGGWIALSGALTWSGLAWCLHRHGLDRHPSEGQWDAIVVLGARVYPGGVPSVTLVERVRIAAQLHAEGRAPTVVLTGGVGDVEVSEAEVAADLAAEFGVPRDALVLEMRSTSTEQNARFAAELFDGRRVLLVTDAYHVLRSERVFARYFDEVHAVGMVHPRVWPRVRGSLREVAAIAAYAVRGRL